MNVRVVSRVAITGVLSVIAVFAIYPVFFMLITSLKSTSQYIRDPLWFPSNWIYLENFYAMFIRFDIIRLYANSVGYIVLAWILSMTVVFPAAYAFAKLEFPARRLLFMALVASMAIPPVTFIIPDYVLFANLGLIDHPVSVVIMWAATTLPGSIFLLSAFLRGVPNEMLDAARIDGAGYFALLRWVLMPMAVPGIIVMTIFEITGWWNDLLTPLIFLQSPEKATMTLGVATTVQRYGEGDTPVLVTGLLLAALPPVLAFVAAQRYIRSGLVLGALR